jgi:protein-tyrosine phosphatase
VVDLHCHVLPGIDDGPPRLEDSLALARFAESQGTMTLVATPHVSWRYVNDPPTIARELEAVREAVREAGLDLQIQSGAEIAVPRLGDLSDEALCELRLGHGPWLLVESPLTQSVGDLEPVLDALHRRGHWIILAHPERSPLFLRDPRRLGALVSKGVLCSITASALVGAFGHEIRSFAAALVREGLVHNISSDAHDVDRRPPVVRAHVEAAAAHVPELTGRIEWLTSEVPQAIITGDVLPKPPGSNLLRARRLR